MKRKFRGLPVVWRMAVLLGVSLCTHTALARDLLLPDRTPVPVQEYPASGPLRLLWLPSGFGSDKAEAPVAAELAKLGIEVWQVDVLEGRLLPPLESSLEQVPDSDITALIELARAGGRRVLLLASARAGVLALRGARAWQIAHATERAALAGVVLIHPNLYLGPPEPGREAAYHPVVAQTRLPVFILQPEQSPWRWRLDATRAELEKGGARVYTRVLTDVRDRFYSRPDATAPEVITARHLATTLRDASLLMADTLIAAPAPTARAPDVVVTTTAVARGLQPYRGEAQAPSLVLDDLGKTQRRLEDYRGRVLLVNFWAAWCPPCVHEMPSMQRLRDKLAGRPFEVLAVNMADSDADVRQFLRDKVSVTFPILMDRNGAALKAWKVFVFPTSFVLDTDGRIRFGVFGEIEWDAPEALERIEALLPARAALIDTGRGAGIIDNSSH
jgi:thiol-disulfide isomerase/thioredoxin